MLKLNVGWSRKVGEPNYGSRGASAHLGLGGMIGAVLPGFGRRAGLFPFLVETELVHQPEELKERIRKLCRLAKASVDDRRGMHRPRPSA